MTRTPHDDVAAFLDDLAASGTPDVADLAVESARTVHDDLLSVPAGERDPVERVRNLEIPGPDGAVGLRIYDPATAGPRPLFVYFHGGGWVFGTADAHDHLARAIANAGDCTVVAVDYRLAPEHPFPAALADCYTATEWVADHPDVLGGDPERLVVGGDSAGGNLAAATCLRARDADGPDIAHQVLVYPVLDRNFETDSYRENAEGYLLTRAAMRWFWDHYLESSFDAKNPYAAPLEARDLSGLPPATVVTAEFDPLRDEDLAYAERLRDAGVPVEVRRYEDMIHGFLPMLADPDLDAAREEVAAIGRTIQSL
ncbi:alpha/beta hydrolase [Halomicroarcula sp. GCM10025817]|uniref:alpha/beta hydrolase n=1 Tax=Haloarcula TaxID=2237 RepID=UPI0023E7E894|nr:alpha/beta hydrolase [Halomicroarcula sp. SYNS111]